MRNASLAIRLALPAILVLAIAAPASAATAPASGAPTATTQVVLAGSGTLAAKGNGTVRLGGSYVATGSMDGGWLKVSGVTTYTIVRVTGWTSKTRFADGSLLFRGVHGSFYIAGRSIVTTIQSSLVRFVATGHGRAALVGTGVYYVNGHGPFRWSDGGANSAF
jgi:hypothetical protein